MGDYQYKEEDESIINNMTDMDLEFLQFNELTTDLRNLLHEVTSESDSEKITEVKLRVVTKSAGLHRLSYYTPILKNLILDGSCVESLRDLGSSLHILETLSVTKCNLKNLDGILGFRNLQCLLARDNFITDPSPCSGIENLKKLDLGNNGIEDIRNFLFLRACTKLEDLFLEGNNLLDYKELIKVFLPQVQILDGQQFTDSVRNNWSLEGNQLTSNLCTFTQEVPKDSSINFQEVSGKEDLDGVQEKKLGFGKVICGNLATSLRSKSREQILEGKANK
ncbi:leucine-rich repeat-containing protein 56 [Cephus cinctus]|uniref:Leucine-rich repeat-containing protein 56 n=1 Tax=Cephus cinctus TaxID=211228 RepID=A0AAJ7VY53_CEPCN|nr:leucine-rich repeat-containing protein 56 [Cephus cinctus]